MLLVKRITVSNATNDTIHIDTEMHALLIHGFVTLLTLVT